MSDQIKIAEVPEGISLSKYHLDTLIASFSKRGGRPFTKDEVTRFVKKGYIDVTNLEDQFSGGELHISIGEADQNDPDFEYSAEDTINVVIDSVTGSLKD